MDQKVLAESFESYAASQKAGGSPEGMPYTGMLFIFQKESGERH